MHLLLNSELQQILLDTTTTLMLVVSFTHQFQFSMPTFLRTLMQLNSCWRWWRQRWRWQSCTWLYVGHTITTGLCI